MAGSGTNMEAIALLHTVCFLGSECFRKKMFKVKVCISYMWKNKGHRRLIMGPYFKLFLYAGPMSKLS